MTSRTVGAAGRSALPFAVGVLEQAAGRGLDLGDLLSRTASRATNVAAFTGEGSGLRLLAVGALGRSCVLGTFDGRVGRLGLG